MSDSLEEIGHLEWLRRRAQAERDEHVRPEIQALIKRGNVTAEEFKKFGSTLNGYEKPGLIAALSDEAFLSEIPNPDSGFPGDKDRLGFNVAFEAFWGTELLRRFKLKGHTTAEIYGEALDDIRVALGRETSDPSVLARDVKDLVEAIESRCDAVKVLKRIREESKP